MRNLLLFSLVVAAAFLPSRLAAFTYADGEVLLIFRKDGFDDTLFNLGSVNQFLGQADGTEVQVSNWNLELVQSKYSLTDGVLVALVAITPKDAASRKAWLTSVEADSVTIRDRTPSQWVSLYGIINATGAKAQEATASEATNAYVVSPSQLSSYSYTASNRGTSPGDIPYLGGASAFRIESSIPARLTFYEIEPSTANPKPEALLVGTFRLDAAGNLIFRAGPEAVEPPAPTQITAITFGANGPEITFNTTVGANYRLRYLAQLTADTASWAIGPDTVAGTGNPATLIDGTATDNVRFYWVESLR